ncbi:MAG TPA: 4-hydroxy-tetrahydrodipicolinate reductase [Planctomycetia bacterium]|nr:4-hydroxy-tetrahydrodipicolinate reductase [Planctomycetia bacterium]
MAELTRVAVHGACGRMGRKVLEQVLGDPELKLVAALDSPRSPLSGTDAGALVGRDPIGVAIGSELPRLVDVVIDFSVPEPSLAIAKACAERELALVVATTGFSAAQREELVAHHHSMPLLVAANCSLVVNLLLKLAKDAGAVLRGRDFDVEIIECHHRYKADAPSGTALQFAQVIEKEMKLTGRRHGREGLTGARPQGEIGIHAVRAGDNVGEHRVIFSTLGETMELVHRGHGRESYAKGAVAAAAYLATKKAGLYSMADVLGL